MQTKNTVEDHSSRLEQVEDRISKLEDKIDVKEKIENCKRNMQELSDSIKKRPNLRIIDIEGKEMKAKGICNKIMTENFPNLEKDLPI
jgi:chromosome segregation ATPase